MIRTAKRSKLGKPVDHRRKSMPKTSKPPAKLGRPPVPRVTPDAAFLDDAMRRKGTNQKELAVRIGTDPTRFSKSKQGERPFTLAEATALARELEVPIETLLSKLGYDIPEHGAPIVGRVLADSRVSQVPGTYAGKRVVAPANTPANAVAYIHEPDGTVFVVAPSEPRAVPPGAYGRVCIVEADNADLPWIGTLDRAKQRDAVSLRPYYGNDAPKLFKQVHSAAIVVAILYL